jgi:hypothetical protein
MMTGDGSDLFQGSTSNSWDGAKFSVCCTSSKEQFHYLIKYCNFTSYTSYSTFGVSMNSHPCWWAADGVRSIGISVSSF